MNERIASRWLCLCVLLASCFDGGSSGFASDAGHEDPPMPGSDGGSAGSAGSAGGGAPLMCMLEQCAALQAPFSDLVEPCCAPSGRCSLRTPGTQCVEQPESDPDCGTVTFEGLSLPTCCLDGVCAINAEVFGLGCLPPEMFGGPGSMGPCDVAAPEDAGVDDAGR